VPRPISPVIANVDAFETWHDWARAWVAHHQQETERAQLEGQAVLVETYPKDRLPTAAQAGILIFVPDEAGGSTFAFSDGTNWRRVADRAIVS
jgi:hypothetical protein